MQTSTKLRRRVIVILLVVCLAALGRLDHLLTLAVETNWLLPLNSTAYAAAAEAHAAEAAAAAPSAADAAIPVDQLLSIRDWCAAEVCLRFSVGWIIAYGLLTIAATALALMLVARQERGGLELLGTPKRDSSPETLMAWMLELLLLVAFLVLSVARVFASIIEDQAIAQALMTTVNVMAPITLILIALVLFLHWKAQAGTPARERWSRALVAANRQRVVVAIVLVFALTVAVVPLGKDQLADALRVVGFGDPLAFGLLMTTVGAALLFSSVVFEASAHLENHADAKPTTPVTARSLWVLVGIVAAVGIALAMTGVFGWGIFVLAGILAALALIVWLSSKLEKQEAKSPPTAVAKPDLPGYLAAAPLLALAVAVTQSLLDTLVVADASGPGWSASEWGLVVLLIAFAGSALLIVSGDRDITRMREPKRRLRWLGVLAPAGLALLLLPLPAEPPVIAAFSTVFGVAVMVYFALLGGSNRVGTAGAALPVSIGVALALVVGIHVVPHQAGVNLGAAAVVACFFASLTTLGYIATRSIDTLEPPALLTRFGVRRMPILTVFVLWWVVAGLVAPAGMHSVRLTATDAGLDPETRESTPTLAQAFDRWLAQQPEFTWTERNGTFEIGSSRDSTPHAVPLVVVASHGGGIRAAYWTALVMDCLASVAPEPGLFGQPASAEPCAGSRRDVGAFDDSVSRIFVASGVSGGAVGLASFAYERNTEGMLRKGWVDDRLSRDLLAPVLGWALYHDLPNHFVGLHSPRPDACAMEMLGACIAQDRSAVLEDAIVDAGDQPLTVRGSLHPQGVEQGRSFPLMVFNGSATGAPARALASPIDLSPWPADARWVSTGDSISRPAVGSADVLDAICSGRDMSFATAAVLAARFTYVSPSGTIDGDCGGLERSPELPGEDECDDMAECALQIADGGYVDNSGMLTVAQLLPELKRLIALQNARTPQHPISLHVVEIDNNYSGENVGASGTARVPESIVPISLRLGAIGVTETIAREQVGVLRSSTCFTTLVPPIRPGVQAPLGWTLSDATRAQLQDALKVSNGSDYSADYWTARQLHDLQAVISYDGTDDAYRSMVHECIPEPRELSEFIQGTWLCTVFRTPSESEVTDVEVADVVIDESEIAITWLHPADRDETRFGYTLSGDGLVTDAGWHLDVPRLTPPEGTSWTIEGVDSAGQPVTLVGSRADGELRVSVGSDDHWACNTPTPGW